MTPHLAPDTSLPVKLSETNYVEAKISSNYLVKLANSLKAPNKVLAPTIKSNSGKDIIPADDKTPSRFFFSAPPVQPPNLTDGAPAFKFSEPVLTDGLPHSWLYDTVRNGLDSFLSQQINNIDNYLYSGLTALTGKVASSFMDNNTLSIPCELQAGKWGNTSLCLTEEAIGDYNQQIANKNAVYKNRQGKVDSALGFGKMVAKELGGWNALKSLQKQGKNWLMNALFGTAIVYESSSKDVFVGPTQLQSIEDKLKNLDYSIIDAIEVLNEKLNGQILSDTVKDFKTATGKLNTSYKELAVSAGESVRWQAACADSDSSTGDCKKLVPLTNERKAYTEANYRKIYASAPVLSDPISKEKPVEKMSIYTDTVDLLKYAVGQYSEKGYSIFKAYEGLQSIYQNFNSQTWDARYDFNEKTLNGIYPAISVLTSAISYDRSVNVKEYLTVTDQLNSISALQALVNLDKVDSDNFDNAVTKSEAVIGRISLNIDHNNLHLKTVADLIAGLEIYYEEAQIDLAKEIYRFKDNAKPSAYNYRTKQWYIPTVFNSVAYHGANSNISVAPYDLFCGAQIFSEENDCWTADASKAAPNAPVGLGSKGNVSYYKKFNGYHYNPTVTLKSNFSKHLYSNDNSTYENSVLSQNDMQLLISQSSFEEGAEKKNLDGVLSSAGFSFTSLDYSAHEPNYQDRTETRGFSIKCPDLLAKPTIAERSKCISESALNGSKHYIKAAEYIKGNYNDALSTANVSKYNVLGWVNKETNWTNTHQYNSIDNVKGYFTGGGRNNAGYSCAKRNGELAFLPENSLDPNKCLTKSEIDAKYAAGKISSSEFGDYFSSSPRHPKTPAWSIHRGDNDFAYANQGDQRVRALDSNLNVVTTPYSSDSSAWEVNDGNPNHYKGILIARAYTSNEANVSDPNFSKVLPSDADKFASCKAAGKCDRYFSEQTVNWLEHRDVKEIPYVDISKIILQSPENTKAQIKAEQKAILAQDANPTLKNLTTGFTGDVYKNNIEFADLGFQASGVEGIDEASADIRTLTFQLYYKSDKEKDYTKGKKINYMQNSKPIDFNQSTDYAFGIVNTLPTNKFLTGRVEVCVYSYNSSKTICNMQNAASKDQPMVTNFWARGQASAWHKGQGVITFHADTYTGISASILPSATLRALVKEQAAPESAWSWGGAVNLKSRLKDNGNFGYDDFLDRNGLTRGVAYNTKVRVCAYDVEGSERCNFTSLNTQSPS
jgi:hypothetical protein